MAWAWGVRRDGLFRRANVGWFHCLGNTGRSSCRQPLTRPTLLLLRLGTDSRPRTYPEPTSHTEGTASTRRGCPDDTHGPRRHHQPALVLTQVDAVSRVHRVALQSCAQSRQNRRFRDHQTIMTKRTRRVICRGPYPSGRSRAEPPSVRLGVSERTSVEILFPQTAQVQPCSYHSGRNKRQAEGEKTGKAMRR